MRCPPPPPAFSEIEDSEGAAAPPYSDARYFIGVLLMIGSQLSPFAIYADVRATVHAFIFLFDAAPHYQIKADTLELDDGITRNAREYRAFIKDECMKRLNSTIASDLLGLAGLPGVVGDYGEGALQPEEDKRPPSMEGMEDQSAAGGALQVALAAGGHGRGKCTSFWLTREDLGVMVFRCPTHVGQNLLPVSSSSWETVTVASYLMIC